MSKNLQQKIADLERRVRELEARPVYVPAPYPVPYPVEPNPYVNPYNPYAPRPVWWGQGTGDFPLGQTITTC